MPNRENINGFANVGQTLAQIPSTSSVVDAANDWINSGQFRYVYGSCTAAICGTCTASPDFSLCSSYLQIIWSATTDVGCVRAQCPNSVQLATCLFGVGVVSGRQPDASSSIQDVSCQYPQPGVAPSGDSVPWWRYPLIAVGAIVGVFGTATYYYCDGYSAESKKKTNLEQDIVEQPATDVQLRSASSDFQFASNCVRENVLFSIVFLDVYKEGFVFVENLFSPLVSLQVK